MKQNLKRWCPCLLLPIISRNWNKRDWRTSESRSSNRWRICGTTRSLPDWGHEKSAMTILLTISLTQRRGHCFLTPCQLHKKKELYPAKMPRNQSTSITRCWTCPIDATFATTSTTFLVITREFEFLSGNILPLGCHRHHLKWKKKVKYLCVQKMCDSNQRYLPGLADDRKRNHG